MTTPILPSLETLKAQAKRLRAGLAEDGDFISHSEALELVARQYGYRDWNTLHAALGNSPPRRAPQVGAHVTGHYLGQPFTGEIIGVDVLSAGRYRVTIDFDKPVDVVSFESFSAFRKRVTSIVDEHGISPARTSNGRPQMEFGG